MFLNSSFQSININIELRVNNNKIMRENLFEFLIVRTLLEHLKIIGLFLVGALVTEVLVSDGVNKPMSLENHAVLKLHVLVDLLVEQVFVLVLVVQGQHVQVKEGDVPLMGDFLGDPFNDLLELLLTGLEGLLERHVAHVQP